MDLVKFRNKDGVLGDLHRHSSKNEWNKCSVTINWSLIQNLQISKVSLIGLWSHLFGLSEIKINTAHCRTLRRPKDGTGISTTVPWFSLLRLIFFWHLPIARFVSIFYSSVEFDSIRPFFLFKNYDENFGWWLTCRLIHKRVIPIMSHSRQKPFFKWPSVNLEVNWSCDSISKPNSDNHNLRFEKSF